MAVYAFHITNDGRNAYQANYAQVPYKKKK